jgi:hypothetical protein
MRWLQNQSVRAPSASKGYRRLAKLRASLATLPLPPSALICQGEAAGGALPLDQPPESTARLPGSGICEIAVNSALAMIEAAAPKDEIEAALAIQMACTHTAAMQVLAKFEGGYGNERRVAALGSAAARLFRAYATQVEVLRRLRQGGRQYMRVEHVHINDGGQAIIGNVRPAKSVRPLECGASDVEAPST